MVLKKVPSRSDLRSLWNADSKSLVVPIQQFWGWVCKIWAFRDTLVTLSAWSRSYIWRNTGTDDSARQLGAIGLVHRAGRGEDGVSWLGYIELEEGLSCTWLERLLAFREQTEALEPPHPLPPQMPSSRNNFSFPSQTNSVSYKPTNFSRQQQKPES